MEIMKYIFIFLLASINALEATSGYNIVLNDASSTIDGTTIGSTAINGVSYSSGVLTFTQAGTFILTGTFNGQIKINTSGEISLVFNGVTIKNTNSNAIYIQKAYELDS